MSWPEPCPGLVIRYSHLWRSEAEAGREEGVKDRPCAIVAAVRNAANETQVYVLPVTHNAPQRPDHAIEIPQATKQRLGLDSERSWIILTETNIFAWPGPDLRFVDDGGPETIAYGMLPPKLMAEVRAHFLAMVRGGRVGQVSRTE